MADEKKIIIDEDWKAQVQAEKEAVAKSRPEDSPAAGEAPSSQAPGDMPMPPASFELLLTMLATEAMVSLGQIANPATGKVDVNRGQAQYLIDLIDVLQDKTKGNLTPGEEQLIETLRHQLHMVFVETAGQGPAQS